MIWIVRFLNLVLITALLLLLLGVAVGSSDGSWCMFPDVSVTRPLPCEWATQLERPA